ncbi:MAG: site-2 protease family protein [Burkholderiaceae bacterium]|nr:site-2 protease family protein [Burkholderiaceae bacterium]
MNDIIQTIAVYALPIIFAITLHEAAHAYAARYFGDLTAYAQGRMSLNPVRHIDPFGTIAIPLVLALLSSPFLFGYAKPVPVDFSRLRRPKRDMLWVALAGPAANLLMALGWMALYLVMDAAGLDEVYFFEVAKAGIVVNLVLFAFNLFPLPPLDGGRIMTSLLPNRFAFPFARLEPYGFFIVLGLALLNLLKYWMIPVVAAANALLSVLVSPLKFLLT